MFSSGKEIFISLGHAEKLTPSDTAVTLTSGGLQRITVTDLKAYTNISGFLQLSGRPFQMKIDVETTLLDLRDRPVVHIGIHNNSWTLRLNHNLRYHFEFDEADEGRPNRVITIVDSQHPDRHLWQIPWDYHTYASVDYAVAGGFLDPVTEVRCCMLLERAPLAHKRLQNSLRKRGFFVAFLRAFEIRRQTSRLS